MGLVVNHEKIDEAAKKELLSICPFSAISEAGGKLVIGSGCKLCKLCVNKGPKGAITFENEPAKAVDKGAWRGVAVFVEHNRGKLHGVTLELIGKARELAAVTRQPVFALVIGSGIGALSSDLLRYGVDRVFAYDDEALADFLMEPYAAAFADFIETVKPSSVLVGATNIGRSLAPRVAARFRTGLTADCTKLEMKKNTDLVQIRPAFGGNIMAQIVTPDNRPQFCTVRYKTFSAPEPGEARGLVEKRVLLPEQLKTGTKILSIREKEKNIDISEAQTVVAVGRGLKNKNDVALAQRLADALGARLACTRPLVENGWFDPRRQIGLSGRTVNAKLIITLGVSGSVQFAAGMRGSQTIAAVNTDASAPIFDVAHYGFVGDLYEIVPSLLSRIGEVR